MYPETLLPKYRHYSYNRANHGMIFQDGMMTGLTEKLLWEEYCAGCKKDVVNACSYIKFAKNYKKFTADKNYTSHIEHKPRSEVEVDWSGPAM